MWISIHSLSQLKVRRAIWRSTIWVSGDCTDSEISIIREKAYDWAPLPAYLVSFGWLKEANTGGTSNGNDWFRRHGINREIQRGGWLYLWLYRNQTWSVDRTVAIARAFIGLRRAAAMDCVIFFLSAHSASMFTDLKYKRNPTLNSLSLSCILFALRCWQTLFRHQLRECLLFGWYAAV